ASDRASRPAGAADRAGGRRPATGPGRPSRLAWGGGGRPLGQGIRPARSVHATSRRGPFPLPPARARVGLRVREPLQRRRLIRPLPARKDRPPVRGRVDRDGSRRGLPPAIGRWTMNRVPIRLRVTLAFTTAMAIVLVAIGFFLYYRLEARLDESIDN